MKFNLIFLALLSLCLLPANSIAFFKKFWASHRETETQNRAATSGGAKPVYNWPSFFLRFKFPRPKSSQKKVPEASIVNPTQSPRIVSPQKSTVSSGSSTIKPGTKESEKSTKAPNFIPKTEKPPQSTTTPTMGHGKSTTPKILDTSTRSTFAQNSEAESQTTTPIFDISSTSAKEMSSMSSVAVPKPTTTQEFFTFTTERPMLISTTYKSENTETMVMSTTTLPLFTSTEGSTSSQQLQRELPTSPSTPRETTPSVLTTIASTTSATTVPTMTSPSNAQVDSQPTSPATTTSPGDAITAQTVATAPFTTTDNSQSTAELQAQELFTQSTTSLSNEKSEPSSEASLGAETATTGLSTTIYPGNTVETEIPTTQLPSTVTFDSSTVGSLESSLTTLSPLMSQQTESLNEPVVTSPAPTSQKETSSKPAQIRTPTVQETRLNESSTDATVTADATSTSDAQETTTAYEITSTVKDGTGDMTTAVTHADAVPVSTSPSTFETTATDTGPESTSPMHAVTSLSTTNDAEETTKSAYMPETSSTTGETISGTYESMQVTTPATTDFSKSSTDESESVSELTSSLPTVSKETKTYETELPAVTDQVSNQEVAITTTQRVGENMETGTMTTQTLEDVNKATEFPILDTSDGKGGYETTFEGISKESTTLIETQPSNHISTPSSTPLSSLGKESTTTSEVDVNSKGSVTTPSPAPTIEQPLTTFSTSKPSTNDGKSNEINIGSTTLADTQPSSTKALKNDNFITSTNSFVKLESTTIRPESEGKTDESVKLETPGLEVEQSTTPLITPSTNYENMMNTNTFTTMAPETSLDKTENNFMTLTNSIGKLESTTESTITSSSSNKEPKGSDTLSTPAIELDGQSTTVSPVTTLAPLEPKTPNTLLPETTTSETEPLDNLKIMTPTSNLPSPTESYASVKSTTSQSIEDSPSSTIIMSQPLNKITSDTNEIQSTTIASESAPKKPTTQLTSTTPHTQVSQISEGSTSSGIVTTKVPNSNTATTSDDPTSIYPLKSSTMTPQLESSTSKATQMPQHNEKSRETTISTTNPGQPITDKSEMKLTSNIIWTTPATVAVPTTTSSTQYPHSSSTLSNIDDGKPGLSNTATLYQSTEPNEIMGSPELTMSDATTKIASETSGPVMTSTNEVKSDGSNTIAPATEVEVVPQNVESSTAPSPTVLEPEHQTIPPSPEIDESTVSDTPHLMSKEEEMESANTMLVSTNPTVDELADHSPEDKSEGNGRFSRGTAFANATDGLSERSKPEVSKASKSDQLAKNETKPISTKILKPRYMRRKTLREKASSTVTKVTIYRETKTISKSRLESDYDYSSENPGNETEKPPKRRPNTPKPEPIDSKNQASDESTTTEPPKSSDKSKNSDKSDIDSYRRRSSKHSGSSSSEESSKKSKKPSLLQGGVDTKNELDKVKAMTKAVKVPGVTPLKMKTRKLPGVKVGRKLNSKGGVSRPSIATRNLPLL